MDKELLLKLMRNLKRLKIKYNNYQDCDLLLDETIKLLYNSIEKKGKKRLKDKKCVTCKKVMEYEEWVKNSLHPVDFFWEKKMYCDTNCVPRAKYRKNKGGN